MMCISSEQTSSLFCTSNHKERFWKMCRFQYRPVPNWSASFYSLFNSVTKWCAILVAAIHCKYFFDKLFVDKRTDVVIIRITEAVFTIVDNSVFRCRHLDETKAVVQYLVTWSHCPDFRPSVVNSLLL